MTIEELLQQRVAELEAERDRWREMAERLSKLVVTVPCPCPQLLPVVAPYVPARAPVVVPFEVPVVVPFEWPQVPPWPWPGVGVTCSGVE